MFLFEDFQRKKEKKSATDLVLYIDFRASINENFDDRGVTLHGSMMKWKVASLKQEINKLELSEKEKQFKKKRKKKKENVLE